MTHPTLPSVPANRPRRAWLAAAAGFVAARVVHAQSPVAPAPSAPSAPSSRAPASTVTTGEGKPGDFDFLAGRWRIHHRRLKADKTWDEFDGEATCWTILGGTGSIEELRIPARDFSGMGIRLLNPKTGVWDDYWVNGKERLLDGGPGQSSCAACGTASRPPRTAGARARRATAARPGTRAGSWTGCERNEDWATDGMRA